MVTQELVPEHFLLGAKDHISVGFRVFLVELRIRLNRPSVGTFSAPEGVRIFDGLLEGSPPFLVEAHVLDTVHLQTLGFWHQVNSEGLGCLEQETLQLAKNSLDRVSTSPAFEELAVHWLSLLEHVQADHFAEDIGMWNLSEEFHVGWAHWVVLGELDANVEHTALEGGVLGSTQISVPLEDRVVQGTSCHSMERNLSFSQLFQILLQASDGVGLLSDNVGPEGGVVGGATTSCSFSHKLYYELYCVFLVCR